MSGNGTNKVRSVGTAVILPVCVTLLLIGLDQLTKALAAAYLMKRPVILIGGVFELRYLENKGAAFGMFRNRQWMFILFAAVITAVCVFVLCRTVGAAKKFVLLRITCMVLAAGALGNMIDRIARGYVIDFLYFSLIDFPVFNVADIYVCVSAAAMIVLFAFVYSDDDLKRASGR